MMLDLNTDGGIEQTKLMKYLYAITVQQGKQILPNNTILDNKNSQKELIFITIYSISRIFMGALRQLFLMFHIV